MRDYRKLLAESREIKEPRFSWGSPRERRKPPSLIERIIQTASPPSEKEQSPPEIPTPTSPQPPREDKDKKKGLGDKLFGWLPRGKRR